jgi:AbrB family looped-hinge helix DNA binding protein
MSIVKVKTKGQVTLPAHMRQQVGLNTGDILEAKIEKGKIILTPKSIIDKRISESLADIKAGRIYGPFNTADEMIKSLNQRMKKRGKKLKRS